VTIYSDSNYARDLDGIKSLTDYVFTLTCSVISWKASLQYSVTVSTTKEEYMALKETTNEGIRLKGLVSDIGLLQEKAIVFCDSQSAICLSKDHVFHDKMKHIDVRYHFIHN